jgi:hypothetical protein
MALDLSKSASVAPPPKRTASKGTATVRQSMKTAEREEAVNGLFQLGAAITMFAGTPTDAATVIHHGPAISRETARIAETNESFARVLDYLTNAGPYAALLTAAMPMALQILVNHKKIPAEPFANFGVVPSETLEARMRAEAAKQQLEMIREAQAAEAEAAEMAREMAESASHGE